MINGYAQLMTSTQVEQLLSRIKTDCSDPSPIGLASQGVPVVLGIGTPGLWYSLSGPTIEDIPGVLDSGDLSVSVDGGSVPFEVIDGFAEFELPLQAGISSSWSLH